ncbi:chromosome condensation complex Condensin, subunit G [Colletotrichum fioriniae]|uniref:chromosome condensation complex Condensin, subunit G n=1 Tax=Colletotrichum fioriniae TaxID=710243 RepID=UPI0032DA56F1|nr:chromosome condensation complex Condensin, subunit G [Colletotrichum fioriniae]
MPARVSTRSTRTSAAVSHKSSAATLGSRASTASRSSSVAADIPTERPDSELRGQVCAVFRDAQRNTASHRKLVVTLRKIQEACAYEPTSLKKTAASDFDEEAFNSEFVRCVLRVMPIKKAESVGERRPFDNEILGEVDEDASIMPETPSTRLTSYLMSTILPLMTAKDKFVRYRSTQLISHIINSLDAIDDDLFQKLRHGLLKRIRDKEAMVRAQAVLGLGRLAGNQVDAAANEDDSEDDEASGLLEKLLEVIQNDPSADVRRSLLVNLPILPSTLPYLLERARDQDALTRRAVTALVFRRLRRGAPPAEPAPPNFDGLHELLERIDVVNSGVENGVALEAMKGFWEGRPDYREAVTFDKNFWETLSAESVFTARSFNDFCRTEGNGKYESLVEEKLPEVTTLAFYLERYLGVLIEAIKRVSQADSEEDEEEDTVEQEFIVEQMLHIAITLDYSDEVGRRKMFALLRQSLSVPELPDDVTKLTINVLRDICAPDNAGEKEFCSVVLEAVADVHDTIVDDPAPDDRTDDSFHSARSEVSGDTTPTRSGSRNKSPELSEEEARAKAVKEIMINMKCLHIVQCMLSNVAGDLQQNDHLVSMLNNLVVPAVRSHEAPVRERGLVCLGLCSLLDRSLAEENLTLFMHFFTKGHTALQITALQILTDILNVHGAQLLSSTPALLKIYIKALKSGIRSPEVQAAATLAVSKLLLGRVVTDQEASAEMLKTLVVQYFDPVTASNQSVRQALNYFLPVFCYSRAENQDLMRTVALDALHALLNVRENLEDDDADVNEEMESLTTIGACLVDWTDPRKCFNPATGLDLEKKTVNGDIHLEFALDILDRLGGNLSKEEKKVVAPLLGKLYISPTSTEEKIREVYDEITIAVNDKLVTDTTGRNALNKIHVSLGKIVANLGEQQDGEPRRMSRSVSVAMSRADSVAPSVAGSVASSRLHDADEDKTVTMEPDIKEEDENSDDTVIQNTRQGDGDSIVSELLSDEEGA